MRRVTFSRNYTLSLSRTCQCYCKYCAFATHRAHIHAPEEVERRLDEAVRRNAKELLVLTGERPEVNPEVAARLAEWGHDDFTSYVVWACERALERGILPHTNIGVLEREDLARLREVTASQGLMLESISERLMETVHAGSPTKHPAQAAGDDRGRRRAEDPVHQRHPRRHRRDRGGAGRIARSAGRGPRPPRPHPGGDPPELRPASAVLRRARWRTSPTRLRASGGRRRGPLPGSAASTDRWSAREFPEDPTASRGAASATPELGEPGLGRRHQAADRASAGG